MRRWKGFTDQVPISSNYTNEFVDNLNISKSASFDTEGQGIITKRHGMFEKVIYSKKEQGTAIITKPRPGHVDTGNYFIFFNDYGVPYVAECTYNKTDGFSIINMGSLSSITNPVSFHLKKFVHNVPQTNLDGVTRIVARELFFVATSVSIATSPYFGWDNFVIEYPDFPLVTNNSNNVIEMTGALWSDLTRINFLVNSTHVYQTEGSSNDHWKIMAEGETGDCIANYEEIYTKDGVKKVGDLKVGDIVLSYDFEKREYCYKPITKIWEKGSLSGYSVGLKNGQHIDISDGHPMWVRTNQGNSHGKKEVSKYEKRYFKDIDLTRWWKRRVPIAKKIPYDVIDIDWLAEDLCFVIGHFIAEGWIEGSHVCSSGYDMTEHIFTILQKNNIPYSDYKNNSGVPCIRFLASKFKEFLKSLKDNSFDIHLPEEIFHLPEEKLKALLDGFWLGDGHNGNYPQKNGTNCNKQEVYSTSSEQLANDIQRIGLQLGTSFYVWKQDQHQGLGNKPIYRISHNTNSHYYKDHGYPGLSEVGIARKHITSIGDVEMRDFEVADTHTFVFKNGIVSHNCEDFALTKAKMLLDMGYPASVMHIECGQSAIGGHAWLVVQTSTGDFALDLNHDDVIYNSAMDIGTYPLYLRQRQIGSNWAFVSDFAWLLSSLNSAPPYTFWYILDPLLNIFYQMDVTGSGTNYASYYPFANPVDTADATALSAPSVNFSSDNNSIYVTFYGTIKEYKLNENKLDLISTKTYTEIGYVGRDGNIVSPTGTYGRQDPDNWGDGGEDIQVTTFAGKNYLASIAASRLGTFRSMYDCEVISEDGFYNYKYRYLTGGFYDSRVDNTETILVEWSDEERPTENYFHMDSTVTYSEADAIINCTTEKGQINITTQLFSSCMNTVFDNPPLFKYWQLLDNNIYMASEEHEYQIDEIYAYYSLHGTIIPFYTINPISPNYDYYLPYMWNHLNITNDNMFFQGALFDRYTDVGDNIHKMYKNGITCKEEIAAVVGVDSDNLLGVVFLPSTDRLNANG